MVNNKNIILYIIFMYKKLSRKKLSRKKLSRKKLSRKISSHKTSLRKFGGNEFSNYIMSTYVSPFLAIQDIVTFKYAFALNFLIIVHRVISEALPFYHFLGINYNTATSKSFDFHNYYFSVIRSNIFIPQTHGFQYTIKNNIYVELAYTDMRLFFNNIADKYNRVDKHKPHYEININLLFNSKSDPITVPRFISEFDLMRYPELPPHLSQLLTTIKLNGIVNYNQLNVPPVQEFAMQQAANEQIASDLPQSNNSRGRRPASRGVPLAPRGRQPAPSYLPAVNPETLSESGNLQIENSKCRELLHELNSKFRTIDAEQINDKAELDNLNSELTTLTEQCVKSKENSDNIRREYENKQAELDNLNSEYENKQAELDALTLEFDKFKEDVNILAETALEARDNNMLLRDNVQRDKIDAVNVEYDALRTKINTLKDLINDFNNS